LAFVPTDQINLIGPIPQVLRIGFGVSGAGAIVAAVAILLLSLRTIANSSIVFTGNTRMPMVAGWDRLLPAWFTRLHPRFRTPVNSIFFCGVVAVSFGVAGIAGAGEQEAFQLLDNAAGILYGLTYLVLFALPLVGRRGAGSVQPAAPRWLCVSAVAGFLTTVLFVTLSIFPIIDVSSWLWFSAKISSVVIGLNLLGVLIYVAARRRRFRHAFGASLIAAASAFAASRSAHAQADSARAGDAKRTALFVARCDSVLRAARGDTVLVETRA